MSYLIFFIKKTTFIMLSKLQACLFSPKKLIEYINLVFTLVTIIDTLKHTDTYSNSDTYKNLLIMNSSTIWAFCVAKKLL